MGVLDRIADPSGYGSDRLPLKPLLGVMMEVADGAITKAQAATVLQADPFNLSGPDLTVDMSAWLDEVLTYASGADRVSYLYRCEALLSALETKVQGLTAAYVKTRLGF